LIDYYSEPQISRDLIDNGYRVNAYTERENETEIRSPYFTPVHYIATFNNIVHHLEPLDFNPETKVNDCLNNVVERGYLLPISLDNPLKEPRTLKTDNRELYDIINA
jgi:hypothetical protein